MEYYVVMSPGASRTVSQVTNHAMPTLTTRIHAILSLSIQEDTSDQSGDSIISYRDHLAMLEGHNRHLEMTVSKNQEEMKSLTALVKHLERRVESLANQLRMVSLGRPIPPSHGSAGSSFSDSPPSPPVSVDDRPPAPLPGKSVIQQ